MKHVIILGVEFFGGAKMSEDNGLINEEELVDETIELTLHSLLTNPTGKHTAFMSSRARIIEDLENRYAKMLSKHKKFNFQVFKKSKEYIFVFKIPSETHDEFLYDVVILFTPKEKEHEKDRTLNRYTLSLFSNSPNFTFTYTYVLSKNDILAKFMKPKCSPKALSDAPKVRNPVEVYGFEKSCYYACMYIKQAGLTNKFDLDSNVFIFNQGKIMRTVASQDDKLKEYNLFKSNKKAKGSKTPSKKKPVTKKKTTK
jgi:hypothetical protein